MNSRQLQYALLVSQCRSFSQAAEQLEISQPALSKQILNLEKELGVQLFDRSTTPLTLTPAGEAFIEESRELLFKEEHLKQIMQKFSTGDYGRLVIGISPFRSVYLIADTVKALHKRYPKLQVILKETGSTELHKGAVEGQYDFAIMNLPIDETILNATPLEPEPIVLAVPNELLTALPQPCQDASYPYPVIDLADCKDIPFIVLSKQQLLRQLFDNLCTLSRLHPTICTEVVGITTAFHMALAGIGATILPLHFILNNRLDSNLSFFSIKHCTFMRKPVIATRKDMELSEHAKFAIEHLQRHGASNELYP